MLNKVTLIGNLGADPEIRQMPSGGSVATISLATTRRWKDKQTGERKDATEWHRVIFFNRTAQVVDEFLKKGSQIYVEGRIQTRKWQDKDGHERYSTEIIGESMHMLGGAKNASANPTSNSQPQPQSHHYPQNPPEFDFDDELPF